MERRRRQQPLRCIRPPRLAPVRVTARGRLLASYVYLVVVPLIGDCANRRGEAPYNRDLSPESRVSSQPPDYVSRLTEDSGEDNDDERDYGAPVKDRKKGVYDSRIEQILYENPELPILITDAGKNHEGGGGYIVYTIRTGVRTALKVTMTYGEARLIV